MHVLLPNPQCAGCVLLLRAAQVHGFSEVAVDASQKAIVTTINYEARDFDSYNFTGGRVDLIFAMKVGACPHAGGQRQPC